MKITKSELREIIQEVASEMGLFEGLTAAQEKLPEPLKKAILKKQGNSSDSEETEEKEDVEEGLTAAQEKLPEPLKKAILKKQGNSDDSSDDEEKEDVEEGLTAAQEKLPEPLKKAILKKQGNSDDSSDEEKEEEEESIEEGNAFGAAVKTARDNGDSEFQVGGKTYQLKEKVTEEVEDTEEFTGEDEDELEETVCETCDEDDEDVEEGNAFGDAVAKAKESGETEFEVGGKTYKVRENWSKITLSEKLDRMLGNRKVL